MSATSPTPAENSEMICSFLLGRCAWSGELLGDGSFRRVDVAIAALPGRPASAVAATGVPGLRPQRCLEPLFRLGSPTTAGGPFVFRTRDFGYTCASPSSEWPIM